MGSEMTGNMGISEVIDYISIQSVLTRANVARDSGLWEELGDCYHPDAMLTTSWFSGTAADFVRGSQEMKVVRHEAESQKHTSSNFMINVRDEKAVAEYDLILYQRRVIQGLELDFETWSRRLQLMLKHNGLWKIYRQTMIYEKDRIQSADPRGIPEDFLASIDFSKYPRQIRYHCWRNDILGFPPPKNLCIKGSEEEQKVREEASNFLSSSA